MSEFKFTDEQSEALTALSGAEHYYVLTGYAGTG